MLSDGQEQNRIGEQDGRTGQVRSWLDASRRAARQGDTERARGLLCAVLRLQPDCAEAWRGLARLSQDPRERSACLRRAHSLASAGQAPAGPAAVPAGRAARWALAAILLLAGLVVVTVLVWGPVERSLAWLLPTPVPAPTPTPTLTPAQIALRFVPELEAALAQGSWERALTIVDIMTSLDPQCQDVQGWATRVHLTYGQALVRSGQPAKAVAQFDQAVALARGNTDARHWQAATRFYLAGKRAFEAADWTVALDALEQARATMPDYLDTAALVAQAYRLRGIAREEQGQLREARADLEAALAINPDDAEAKTHLDQVMLKLFPPKRIVIDISEQHFYAYEGDALVYSFVTSTGLPGRDTATGHYQVLDKIPMAYSSIWHLKMPYWLGIYYVGGIENGIHALPIRPDGTVMWGGLLGQKASYGCVILSTEAAKIIFDWAEIGTPVDIRY